MVLLSFGFGRVVWCRFTHCFKFFEFFYTTHSDFSFSRLRPLPFITHPKMMHRACDTTTFLAPPAARTNYDESRRAILKESRSKARNFAKTMRGMDTRSKWTEVLRYLHSNNPLPFACDNPVSVFGALQLDGVLADVTDVAEFKTAAERVTHPVYCKRKGRWWLQASNKNKKNQKTPGVVKR